MKLSKMSFERQSEKQKFEELTNINNCLKQLTGVEIFPRSYRDKLKKQISDTNSEVSEYEKYMTKEELEEFNSLPC